VIQPYFIFYFDTRSGESGCAGYGAKKNSLQFASHDQNRFSLFFTTEEFISNKNIKELSI